MSYVMVIDLKRCVGCHSCANNCKQENGTPPGVTRARVMRGETGVYPNAKRLSIPVLCMHCENPPCVKACPSGASTKDEKTGVVTVDKEICIGCRACQTACPYGARYFRKDELGYFGATLTPYEEMKYGNMPANVVDKCDFCADRRANNLEPACVQACIAKARHFGEYDELAPLIQRRKGYRLREELGTEPSVWYLP